MENRKVTEQIRYIGADDKTIDLFESQYKVPNGVSYNSYLILDEKTAVMDTVDFRKTKEWLKNLEEELAGRSVDYLIVSHLEPDHAGSIGVLAAKYPEMKLVGNVKTFQMLPQFFDFDLTGRCVTVKEGDSLSLGTHELVFVMAPMVHWPEVMVAYEKSEKILFSADGFGKFGALDCEEAWEDEARRYYINIVGKYGPSVQALLKKAAALDIQMICPLHGPVLTENLAHYLSLYDIWSRYLPEKKGVLVAYASIHGNTKKAAEEMGKALKEAGEENVILTDLSRSDMSQAVSDAFCYDRIVLACATYDGGLFLPMEDFLNHLKCKTFRNRKAGLIENGSWAPLAAKKMREELESMKDITICENVVTIRSCLKKENIEAIRALAKELTEKE